MTRDLDLLLGSLTSSDEIRKLNICDYTTCYIYEYEDVRRWAYIFVFGGILYH